VTELDLDQVLRARRTATHPGPPRVRIRFEEEGPLWIESGSWLGILSEPPSWLPRRGWRHHGRCRCQFCLVTAQL
jgi:hypothetical protein